MSSPPDSPSSSAPSSPTHTNRLARESSPYLLQHAHNPVDWHPWGEEAFRLAREQNKPIFLSVGYSTCYWCHVMERQCFENESIAQLMNERFINIKVDREERPDVDQLYMTAVQVMTRQGGWPMSVFLTPQLRPFFGGTYFPPEDMSDGRGGGRPGFPRILLGLDDAWQSRRPEVEQSADQLLSVLHQLATPRPPEADITFDAAKFDEYITRSVSDYEPVHGGFGRAPKLPRQTLLKLLLSYIDGPARRNPQLTRKVRDMLRHTLDEMDRGGIHDHLGGGFHRYSTDARWLVPHFEIMLYDQAMLADVYATAARIFCDDDAAPPVPHPRWSGVARGICDFVLREMTSPDGAFFTAFDAEVDHYEGQNYLWTKSEIESILGTEDAALFNCVYGVDQGPNFADPHASGGEGPDRNILFLDRTLEQACHEHGLSLDELSSRLGAMRAKLKTVRDQRKQPLLDTKILTGWNALMASALAVAGQVLGEPRYTQAAIANCRFLLSRHRTADGGLYRTSRDGAPRYAAFLDDYAALAHACIATGDAELLDQARALADQIVGRFGAAACHEKEEGGSRGSCAGCGSGGLFFTDASADDLIVRQKVATDSPLPSGNALAADVLRRLGLADRAQAIFREFAQTIEDNAEATSALLESLIRLVRSREEPSLTVLASAAPRDADTNPLPQPGASPQELAHRAVNIEGMFESATTLLIRLNIAPGYHLTPPESLAPSVHPASQRLDLTFPDAETTYPAPTRVQLPLAPEPLDVYQGQIVLTVRFALPPSGSVQGALRYQPCTDDACLPVVVQPMELRVG